MESSSRRRERTLRTNNSSKAVITISNSRAVPEAESIMTIIITIIMRTIQGAINSSPEEGPHRMHRRIRAKDLSKVSSNANRIVIKARSRNILREHSLSNSSLPSREMIIFGRLKILSNNRIHALRIRLVIRIVNKSEDRILMARTSLPVRILRM